MKIIAVSLLAILLFTSCSNSQKQINPKLVGAPCEGCEAIFEYGDINLTPTDTLPDFNKNGVQIKVEGTIYQADGKTPAENVILYVHHTNTEGLHAPSDDAQGWGKKHGYNRGWVKTGKNGCYAIYTVKPAPYPNRSMAAHMHYEILEPNGKYYWFGSCHFEGDPQLTAEKINPDSPRGGSSGLLSLKKKEIYWLGKEILF